MALNDHELDRYARHIILREIGGKGQARLRAARVLVIGAGGLGAPALLYLAAAGVGVLGVVDDDTVSLSNLQRQVIHSTARIGALKTDSAAAAIAAVNDGVQVLGHAVRLNAQNAEAIIGGYDLVCDGTDNFDARYLVNETCARLRKPLVAAAIGQWDGQISVYKPWEGGPCYACVFPHRPAEGLAPSCAEAGVVGALPGVMGSLMAMETIKLITGAGESLAGAMLLYDALGAEFRRMKLRKAADCPVCAGL